MTRVTNTHAAMIAQVARQWAAPADELSVEVRPINGGLEASSIQRLTVRHPRRDERTRVMSVVAKQLSGAAVREARVYQRLVGPYVSGLSPQLLRVEYAGANATIYLEPLRPVSRWPWRNSRSTQQVLERLTTLHATVVNRSVKSALAGWDYESELQRSADLTLERLAQCRRNSVLSSLCRSLAPIRRVIDALPLLRRQLLSFSPFGRAVLHGDVHPGNALLRTRKGQHEPAFLDWGRARIGSPLEDVVSWLQSLGYWEPEARRRHDTLLAHYLQVRGLDSRLTQSIREACWLAGASNALSGALAYHLTVAGDAARSETARARALHAAHDWLRILRRAAAYTG